MEREEYESQDEEDTEEERQSTLRKQANEEADQKRIANALALQSEALHNQLKATLRLEKERLIRLDEQKKAFRLRQIQLEEKEKSLQRDEKRLHQQQMAAKEEALNIEERRLADANRLRTEQL